MIETYQEKESLNTPKPAIQNFATIGEIYDDGVSLIFDGEENASEKHYKTNAFVVFAPGDRVRIISDSGTYVVEYPVGNPRRTMTADTATTAETVKTADTAKKLSTPRTFTLTGDVEGSASFDGSANCTINVTGIRVPCLENDYSSSSGYNIYLYARYSNQLSYRVGRNGTLHDLQNA